MAAGLTVLVTNPLEVVKTRLQLAGEGVHGAHRPSAVSTFVSIARREGPRGLQAGLLAGIAYQVVMNGTRLGGYEHAKALFPDWLGGARSTLAGAATGVIGAFASSPFFQVKVRLQNRQEVDMLSGFRSVTKHEGWLGLMRGANGAMLRVAVGSAAQLTSYDFLKRHISRLTGLAGIPLHFASSLAASLAVIAVMNPFDVVSTRLYNDVHRKYRSILHCFAATIRTEGLPALYKGAIAHYFRLGPHTILTFVFWEQCKLGADACIRLYATPLSSSEQVR